MVSIHHLTQKPALKEYFIHRALLTLGESLISIFIPIFLLKQGFNLTEVFLFYCVNSLVSLLGIWAAIQLSHHTNPNNLLFANPLSYAILISVFESNASFPVMLIASAIAGLLSEIYWVVYNVDLFENLGEGSEGNELSILDLIQQIVASLSPYMGGLFIVFFGYGNLFYVAIAVMTLSIIPTLFLKPLEDGWKFKINLKDFKKHSKILPSMLVPTIPVTISAAILWPIFVQQLTANESLTGLIITITGVTTLFTTLFVRKKIDTNNKILLAVSSLVYGSIWLIRALPTTFSHIVIMSILIGISGKAFFLNSFSAVTKYAKKQKTVDFVVFRELAINGLRAATYGLLVLIPTEIVIQLSFIITGLTVLAMGVYTLEKV